MIYPVLLPLRRMLALSLSVGNYSTAESWRSLLAPRCWRCACCLFSFSLCVSLALFLFRFYSLISDNASRGVMISNFNWPSECRVSWVNREFRTMRGINTAMLCRYSTDCGNVRAIRRYSYGCARVIITAYTRRRPLGVLFSSVSKRVLTYPCARDNVLLKTSPRQKPIKASMLRSSTGPNESSLFFYFSFVQLHLTYVRTRIDA